MGSGKEAERIVDLRLLIVDWVVFNAEGGGDFLTQRV